MKKQQRETSDKNSQLQSQDGQYDSWLDLNTSMEWIGYQEIAEEILSSITIPQK